MGTGKAGKAAKRNLGRGGKKVGGGKESGATRPLSLAEVVDIKNRVVADLSCGNYWKMSDARTWIVEQAIRSYNHNPQTFWNYPPRRIGEEVFAEWSYAMADKE